MMILQYCLTIVQNGKRVLGSQQEIVIQARVIDIMDCGGKE